MSINMLLACGLNGELGQTSSPDGLPWSKNTDDMKFFKRMTKGNVVVMGGNTFRQLQGIGFENGLPERDNLVVTSNENKISLIYDEEYYCQVESLEYIVHFLRLQNRHDNPIFIIGGKSIYEQLHPYCDKVYLTRINQDFPDADVRINLDFLEDFKIVDKIPLNDYSEVEVWERK